MNPLKEARRRARAAQEHKRAAAFHKDELARTLEELRAWCQEYGIDFEEIRTEAKGHGPREARAS